jgi:hypothetical protein
VNRAASVARRWRLIHRRNELNPYVYVLSTLPTAASGNIELAALAAVLQLLGEAYSSGFTRGAGNNEFDYVVRAVNAKFGATHPVAYRLAQIVGDKLGK